MICISCKIDKSSEMFSRNKSRKSGYTNTCKECRSVYIKKHYVDNKEYYKDKANSRRLSKPEDILDGKLKYSFNISLEQFKYLLKLQNNVCAICKQPSKDKRIAVDHCHVTGKVRGLLCNNCNLALGCFKDNINFLASAINYLSSEPLILQGVDDCSKQSDEEFDSP